MLCTHLKGSLGVGGGPSWVGDESSLAVWLRTHRGQNLGLLSGLLYWALLIWEMGLLFMAVHIHAQTDQWY